MVAVLADRSYLRLEGGTCLAQTCLTAICPAPNPGLHYSDSHFHTDTATHTRHSRDRRRRARPDSHSESLSDCDPATHSHGLPHEYALSYCRTGADGGPQPYSQPDLDSHTGTYRDSGPDCDTTAHRDTNTNFATYIYPSAYEHAPTNPDPYTHASHQVRVAIPALRTHGRPNPS